jgi:hypothetical protein
MTTADLTVLAPESGFVQVGAARPTGSLNYAVATAIAGNPFEVAGTNADWTPTALLAATPLLGEPATVIAYTGGSLLGNVVIGTWALWGDEIVRVDEIETMTLARACGDTTPKEHAADERIWFIGDWYGTDNREYVDGETVQAKALTRTGQDQLALDSAPTVSVEMASRQVRPYPPGRLRFTDDLVTDVAYPPSLAGELEVTWAHRDRLLQEDLLVPEGDADIGPETGTTYTVKYYLDGVIDDTETGITGTAATPVTLSGDGEVYVEVFAERDGFVSLQAAACLFDYTVVPADYRITDSSNDRITDSGNRRITD